MTRLNLRTLDEAAAEFRVSRRFFQDFIRKNPFYRVLGRRKLFSDDDMRRLFELLPCPSNSARRAPAKRRIGKSEAPTSESTLNELRALLTKPSHNSCLAPSESRSNVVSMPARSSR